MLSSSPLKVTVRCNFISWTGYYFGFDYHRLERKVSMNLSKDTILAIVASVFLIFSSLLEPIVTAVLGIILLIVGIVFVFSKNKNIS